MSKPVSEMIASAIRAHRGVFVAAVVALTLVMWVTVGALLWFVRDTVTDLPDREALRGVGSMAQATTLLDVKGRHAFTIFKEQRIEVPLERVSPNLVRAILAVEDQRFYDHGGIDVVRVAGAAWNNVLERRAAQGGSTLTQQLARQSFLSPAKTVTRKLKEIVVAARLEEEFTKDEILELYLNKVYFGDGLYGVEAASRGYFGKHAADLDVPEAALLAGLVKSPSTYAPTVSRDRAVARRNVVLQAMRGAGMLDGAEYDTAIKAPVRLNDNLRQEEAYGQYFKEEVRKQLVQQFGWERVYQGGLRVTTTLDLDMQKAAEAEVARAIADIEKRQAARRGNRRAPAAADPLQAALVALDPKTGEVRAMVGGRRFNDSKFNRATQARRQPGSAFKPFVYAAALERGHTPATLITGLSQPVMTLQGAWVPEDEHLEGDAITMRAALRTSSNRAAVRMLEEVGIAATVRYAQRLGVGSVPSVPSLALGSGEVTLLSMTAAFGAFANDGMLAQPLLLRKVETTDGEVLYQGSPKTERAVSEATAYLISTMLADVINAGTAWQARRVGFRLPAAGKTGTTNDYHDAWFVGYTPALVSGVWVGYDQPRTIIGSGYAGDIAVPMWGRFMTAATRGDEPEWFRAPATVTSANICRLSGKLPNEACHSAAVLNSDGTTSNSSMVYTEFFVRGTEPSDYCPFHRLAFPGALATSGHMPEPSAPPPGVVTAPVVTGGTVLTDGSSKGSAEAAAAEAPQPQRRRGFWSRIFGRGGDDDAKKKQEEEKKRQEEERRQQTQR
jgi:1A family penicillin-binding protein